MPKLMLRYLHPFLPTGDVKDYCNSKATYSELLHGTKDRRHLKRVNAIKNSYIATKEKKTAGFKIQEWLLTAETCLQLKAGIVDFPNFADKMKDMKLFLAAAAKSQLLPGVPFKVGDPNCY